MPPNVITDSPEDLLIRSYAASSSRILGRIGKIGGECLFAELKEAQWPGESGIL